MSSFDVSIVVCVYNGEKSLEDCIQSLLSLSYPKGSYEIIFVDDGSTDNSREICLSFLRQNHSIMTSYYRIKHSGLSFARNMGWAKSRAPIVLYIDQDAIADRGLLESVVSSHRDKTIGVVGGVIKLSKPETYFQYLLSRAYYDLQGKNKDLVGACLAYKKEVFENVGGFFVMFTGYGDEKAFNLKVLQGYGATVDSRAIVEHDMAREFLPWIKKRFMDGRRAIAILRLRAALLNQNHYKEIFCSILNKIANLLFVIFLFGLIWWQNISFHVFLGVLAIPVVFRYFSRGIVARIFAAFNKDGIRGLASFPIGALIFLLGMFSEDMGFVSVLFGNPRIDLSDELDLGRLEEERVSVLCASS